MHSICNDEFHSAIKYQPKSNQTLVTALEDYLKSWVNRVNTVFTRAKQRRIDRQAFSHLLSLDDHILDDIGVSRSDVILVSRLPLDINASRELDKIARANQS